MANITVLTSSNFDDVSNHALGNADTVTVGDYQSHNITFTINSDTRWAQNGAVVGPITYSQYGYNNILSFDGRDVWWLPFDASSGNHHLAVAGGIADDGGAQTVQTAAANNATVNDMTLLPAIPANNDAYYFGYAGSPWTRLWVNIGQAGAGVWTITWEYWNGAAWAALTNVTDNTTNFRAAAGWKDVRFSIPTAWAASTIQGVNAYWIRARVSEYTSVVTQPLGTQARIDTLGMTLTGAGGAYGEIIGTWDTMGAAPVDPSSTSATGWIKLRSKMGDFVDNEALSINGTAYNSALVNSSTGGQRGWIHIVGNSGNAVTVEGAKNTYRCRGDWFYLGTTTGVRGQTVQFPVADQVPGVWVETAESSGNYEFWPNVGAVYWDATILGLDERCKFIYCNPSGVVYFGRTVAGVDCAYIPPANCRVRIPNVIVSVSSSADWNANLNATAANVYLTSSTTQNTDIEYMCACATYLGANYPITYRCLHSCTGRALSIWNNQYTPLYLEDVHTGWTYNTLITMTSAYQHQFVVNTNGTLDNVTFINGTTTTASSHYILSGYANDNVTFRNIKIIDLMPRAASVTHAAFGWQNIRNCTLENITCICCSFSGPTYASKDLNNRFSNIKVYDTFIGTTSSTVVTLYGGAMTLGTCCIYENQQNNPVADTQPKNTLCGYIGTGKKLRMRKLGTPSIPLQCGVVNPVATIVGYSDSSTEIIEDLKISGLYVTDTYTNADWIGGANCYGLNKVMLENVWLKTATVLTKNWKNTSIRGCWGMGNNTGFGSIGLYRYSSYGTHFWDAFHSTVRGKIGLLFYQKTTIEPSASSYTVTAEPVNFQTNGMMNMPTIGGQVIYTWPWYILGYTGFTADAVQFTANNGTGGTYGYGNFRIRYCLDKNDGNGFGNWKECTAANLNAETGISPTLGFKPKFEFSCIASGSNYIAGFYIFGATDAVSQQVQYPITEELMITLKNVVVGSTYTVTHASNGTVLATGVAAAATIPLILTVDYTETTLDVNVLLTNTTTRPQYVPYTEKVSLDWQDDDRSMTAHQVQKPTQLITVSGLTASDQVAAFLLTGPGGTINKNMCGGCAATPIGSNFLNVVGPIPEDVPSVGSVRVIDATDGSEQIYAYTGITGNQFTGLSPVTVVGYDVGDTLYVPYIDVASLSNSVTNNIVYTADRNVLVRVRRNGIVPFEKEATINSAGMHVVAFEADDPALP